MTVARQQDAVRVVAVGLEGIKEGEDAAGVDTLGGRRAGREGSHPATLVPDGATFLRRPCAAWLSFSS